MGKLCQENNWGDPFSYARSREIYMAAKLGHKVAESYSGADGIDEDGNGAEYKSTICKTISATYNGISVQETWEEQRDYLRNKKIGCYPNHYFARFEDHGIAEMYVAPANKVLDTLEPKLYNSFTKSLHRKDPRLGASLTKGQILKISRKII
jgi:hypothetical protein